jgi:DNA-binding transcriptional regulator/RsmH inhibitor MraZ
MIKVVLFLVMALLAPALGNGAQEMAARDQGLSTATKASGPEAEARELQRIKSSAKYGYIDRTGKIVIPPRFDGAGKFSEGRAIVIIDGKYGYIDKTGKVVIQPQFIRQHIRKWSRSIGDFSEGLAVVLVRENGLFGFIDRSGNQVIPLKFTGVLDFSQGLAQATVDPNREKIGFINQQGDWVIPPQFQDATDFSEDLAAVQLGEESGANWEKWGYIDRKGTMVIPPRFDEASEFREGLATVQIGDDSAVIDKQGQVVIKDRPGFYRFGHFSQGRAAFHVSPHRSKEGKMEMGFMDKTGKVVIAPRFTYVGEFSEGLATIEVDEKTGFIDLSGKVVIPAQFRFAGSFSEGLSHLEDNRGMHGYIDQTGKVVIEPKFLEAGPFSEGLAPVQVMPEKAGGGKAP